MRKMPHHIIVQIGKQFVKTGALAGGDVIELFGRRFIFGGGDEQISIDCVIDVAGNSGHNTYFPATCNYYFLILKIISYVNLLE